MIATETTSKVEEFRAMREGLKFRLEEIEAEKAAILSVLGAAAEPAKRKPGRPRGSKSKLAVEVTA